MSDKIVVCPVGGHTANYEYFGPFEGTGHARLWLTTVHSECVWTDELPDDFQRQDGHLIKSIRYTELPAENRA